MRIIRWPVPSSPIARRAALTRLVTADTVTQRLPQTVSSSSACADHPVAVAHQQQEDGEDLWLDVDEVAAPA